MVITDDVKCVGYIDTCIDRCCSAQVLCSVKFFDEFVWKLNYLKMCLGDDNYTFDCVWEHIYLLTNSIG